MSPLERFATTSLAGEPVWLPAALPRGGARSNTRRSVCTSRNRRFAGPGVAQCLPGPATGAAQGERPVWIKLLAGPAAEHDGLTNPVEGQSALEALSGSTGRVLVRREGQASVGCVRDDDPSDVGVLLQNGSKQVRERVGLRSERHVGEGHGEVEEAAVVLYPDPRGVGSLRLGTLPSHHAQGSLALVAFHRVPGQAGAERSLPRADGRPSPGTGHDVACSPRGHALVAPDGKTVTLKTGDELRTVQGPGRLPTGP